jgi:hypothetical protein
MQAIGMNAGRYPLDWIRRQNPIGEAMQARFGRDDLIANHSHPYIYLNLVAIDEAGLEVAEVEQFVAAEFMKFPGIAYGLTRSDILAGRVPDARIPLMIQGSFNTSRSGNVHLVQEQNWLFHSTEEAEKLGVGDLAAIHGSPWRYDTYVPILFAGPGIPTLTVSRRVAPYDIAPTLANYLGIKPPSGSIGEVLPEVVAGDR